MQVQAVNTYNYQTLTPVPCQSPMGKNVSFGSIFCPKDVHFNKVQEPIVDSIKKAMREPLQKFKWKTAEDFYKSKGYDFGIEPYSYHSVFLTAYKGMEETGAGAGKKYSYLDRVFIGEYDRKSEFKVSDVTAEIKNKTWADGMLIALMVSGICGILVTVGLNVKQSMNTEPLIENVDSIANKAKAVIPDTTKVLKVIRK